MYRLYRITKDPNHLRFAAMFDKPNFWEPMAQGNDVLPGLHANTHLAQASMVPRTGRRGRLRGPSASCVDERAAHANRAGVHAHTYIATYVCATSVYICSLLASAALGVDAAPG